MPLNWQIFFKNNPKNKSENSEPCVYCGFGSLVYNKWEPKEEKEMIEVRDGDGNVIDAVRDCVKPDMVNHPPHYEREGAMECIDEMLMIFGPLETKIFCKLNAWKYRYRAADKNGKEDIAKSDWYMNKYKEIEENYGKYAERR